MKYTEAWSSVVSQNLNLKIATGILGIVAVLLGMITLKLAFKDNVVIERGCYSRAIAPVNDQHSPDEIANFLREALAQRFDSVVQPVDGLLSPEELKMRLQEQKELESRNMKQKIIVNSVQQTGDSFTVDADRLISVNEVRSAFKFQLTVKLESKARSASNPYGLLLTTTKQIEQKDKK